MKTHEFTYKGKTFRSHSIVDMMEQITKEYGFEGKIDYNDDLNEYLGSFCGKSLAVDGVYVAIKNGVSNFAEMTNRKTGVYCELDLDDESRTDEPHRIPFIGTPFTVSFFLYPHPPFCRRIYPRPHQENFPIEACFQKYKIWHIITCCSESCRFFTISSMVM